MEEKFLSNDSRAVIERFELLKAMNTIIKFCNDEGVYESWIYVIPDQCEDEELLEIAEDFPESYQDACSLFRSLAKGDYFQDGGFYVGRQVF